MGDLSGDAFVRRDLRSLRPSVIRSWTQAEGDARSKTINAAADAEVTRVTGEATAARTLAVGSADAKFIELKVKSMESGNYAAVQVAEALSRATPRIVPEIVASGSGGGLPWGRAIIEGGFKP